MIPILRNLAHLALLATALPGALWTTPISTEGSATVVTPTGNIMADGCTSVAPDGVVAWSLLPMIQAFPGCTTGIGDAQGNSYIQTVDSASNDVVESIDSSGNVGWTTPTGGFVPFRGITPVVGANGSVYFAEWNGATSKVLGFDEQTGAITFDQSFEDVTGLYAYAGGLIVVDTDSTVHYIGYDGSAQNTYTTGTPISAYEAYSNAGGAGGAVFLAGYGGSCSGGIASVDKFTPTGLAWIWTDSTARGCSQTLLAATPDGGVILARNEAAPSPSADFTSISPAGTFRWDHHANGPSGPAFDGGYLPPIADVNGVVALPSIFSYTCPGNISGECRGAQVEFVSQQVDQRTRPTLEVTDAAGEEYYYLHSLATDSGRAYLAGEDRSGERSLSAFSIPRLAMNYRLALQEALTGGSISTPPTSGNSPGESSPGHGGGATPPPPIYAALGDSYSSGQGDPPFMTDTATATDKCHRSSTAYAELLHGTLGFPASLRFVACSGAKIANLYPGKGQYRERGQLEALSRQDSIVSLTIGGNDVEFGLLMKSCVILPECYLSDDLPTRVLIKHTLGRLPKLYREILRRAPSAEIYVLGYPHFFSRHPSLLCNGIDQLEAIWITRMEDLLNDGIHKAIEKLDDRRLRFIDTSNAFAGGELCSKKKPVYMNGIIKAHLEYSFHPTAAGQRRLAEVLARVVRGD